MDEVRADQPGNWLVIKHFFVSSEVFQDRFQLHWSPHRELFVATDE
jgi:hypothetical protein